MNEVNNNYADMMAKRDYAHALRQSFWRQLRNRLLRKCNDLISTHQLLENLCIQGYTKIGLQKVAIDRIIGSSGRYHEFDLDFLPRRKEPDGRWLNIARARYKGIQLPPPILYKIGDGYFVEDGNHRISVARTNGQEHIEAFVIVIKTTNLIAKPACKRLGFKGEAKMEAVPTVESFRKPSPRNCN